METLEQLKEIVKNAPSESTHIEKLASSQVYYLKRVNQYGVYGYKFYSVDHGCYIEGEAVSGHVRSLSDIKCIIELMESVKSLPDKLETDKWLEGLDRPTEFAISQAKSFAIGSVFDSIRKAKELL